MPDSAVALLTGAVVGLMIREIMSSKAYGTIADMLLGITGAFASQWLMENLASSSAIPWNYRLLSSVWGAATLPILAHVFSNRRPSAG